MGDARISHQNEDKGGTRMQIRLCEEKSVNSDLL